MGEYFLHVKYALAKLLVQVLGSHAKRPGHSEVQSDNVAMLGNITSFAMLMVLIMNDIKNYIKINELILFSLYDHNNNNNILIKYTECIHSDT